MSYQTDSAALSEPHSAAERLGVLLGQVWGSGRGAASQRGRGVFAADRLQAHWLLHRPRSCVGAGRARLQHTHIVSVILNIWDDNLSPQCAGCYSACSSLQYFDEHSYLC